MSSSDSAPVYDERGNVRPRGTEGARPMTYEERVAIANTTSHAVSTKSKNKK